MVAADVPEATRMRRQSQHEFAGLNVDTVVDFLDRRCGRTVETLYPDNSRSGLCRSKQLPCWHSSQQICLKPRGAVWQLQEYMTVELR